MSVEFVNVGKIVGRGKYAHTLFDDLNFRVENGTRIAILGLPKSGKSTLLRLICGTDHADSGSIQRSSSVSWPIPLGDFLVSFSTVAANIKFIMRLYGLDSDQTVRAIAELVEISEFLNTRLGDCPRHVKQRLAFALGVGLGFDICLFDQRVSAVDKDFKEKSINIVKSLSPDKAIVVATSNPKEVAEVCDTVFVLESGKLTPFSDIKDAIEHLKALMGMNEDNEPDATDAGAEPVDEEFVLEIGI